MNVVLGLGNPGARYRRTRHNLGHRVVERLAERWGGAFAVDPALGRAVSVARVRIGPQATILSKAMTYMNRSGRAAVALVERFGDGPGDLLVVYDDADLALGRVRIRQEGGPGGHNGMRSIIAALRTQDFPRVRLGILGDRRDDSDLADYVLEEFDESERDIVHDLIELGADAVEAVVGSGLTEAMNRFNRRATGPESGRSDDDPVPGPR